MKKIFTFENLIDNINNAKKVDVYVDGIDSTFRIYPINLRSQVRCCLCRDLEK